MNKFNFQKASIPQSELEIIITDLACKWNSGDAEIRSCFPEAKTPAEAEKIIRARVYDLHAGGEIYLSDVYQVEVCYTPDRWLAHLSIKRRDRGVCHDWRDFQEIKNALVGPECEAVELYPAESRLVDGANQYHIWCVTNPTYRFPFGFTERMVSETVIGKSMQRPFDAK